MPIYEYRCERGHTFEVMQRMTDDPFTVCEEHGTPIQRVFHPVAVHFKGSGFYNTDYGKSKGKGGADKSKDSESSSASSDSKGSSDSSSNSSDSSDSKDSKPSSSDSKKASASSKSGD